MNTVRQQTLIKYPAANLAGLESQIGNTPLLALQRVTSHLPAEVQIFAKAEWLNPGGSVKDRPAINILRTALSNGELGKGRRLLDSTSGNMGISYATFGAALGIPVTLCVPASASAERIVTLRALGAQLILTDPSEGADGALCFRVRPPGAQAHVFVVQPAAGCVYDTMARKILHSLLRPEVALPDIR